MQIKEIITKTLDKNGADYELNVCMEELAELIQAISKCRRYGKMSAHRMNLIEEMADVEIILIMLTEIYGITPEEIKTMENQKLMRLERKLGE